MNIVIVGEMPSKKGDGSPFSGPSGERLTKALGHDWRFAMQGVNLFPIRVQAWKKTIARKRGQQLRESFAKDKQYWVVLLAGRKVADSFGFAKDEPFFQRLVRRHVRYYIIPHPSGLSRWWNDPKNVKRFETFLRNLVETERAVGAR